jgi:transcriptional regulator with XRE-family HTH domain
VRTLHMGEGMTAAPFGVALGHRLRQVREELGETASDLAKSCRWVGLNWDRTILTRVELGQRKVTADEILLLTLVYGRPVADLLPTESVALSTGPRGTIVTPAGLRDCLTERGHVADWHVGPGWLADFEAARPRILESFRHLADQVPGAAEMDVLGASQHIKDEATTKAAKALGATPLEVAAAAEQLWNHGIAAERDGRADALGPAPNARARQAQRGHVTRRLLEELRPVIEEIRTDKRTEDGDRGER